MSWERAAQEVATQAAPGVAKLLTEVVMAIIRGRWDLAANRKAEEASRRMAVKLGVDAVLKAKAPKR